MEAARVPKAVVCAEVRWTWKGAKNNNVDTMSITSAVNLKSDLATFQKLLGFLIVMSIAL